MDRDNPADAIFIHSLWRSGSTYMFNAFRRSETPYWCYQEPVHEFVLNMRDDPDSLLTIGQGSADMLRHPKLDRPYFQEGYDSYHFWKDHIKKEIIYDEYFDEIGSENLKNYLLSLIEGARSRPVIQECRTSNRIKTIRNICGGKHIYLWRNPWDQWWSFKATSYFDVVIQMIVNAPHFPAAIYNLRKAINFQPLNDSDISKEFLHFELRTLEPEKAFLTFYVLWCLAWISGSEHADIDINIDSLTASETYRNQCLATLETLGIDGLDFADCQVHWTTFTQADEKFFHPIEERAHALLLRSGIGLDTLKKLSMARAAHAPNPQKNLSLDRNYDNLLEDSSRFRKIILRKDLQLFNQTNHLFNYIGDREHSLLKTIQQNDELHDDDRAQIALLTDRCEKADQATAQARDIGRQLEQQISDFRQQAAEARLSLLTAHAHERAEAHLERLHRERDWEERLATTVEALHAAQKAVLDREIAFESRLLEEKRSSDALILSVTESRDRLEAAYNQVVTNFQAAAGEWRELESALRNERIEAANLAIVDRDALHQAHIVAVQHERALHLAAMDDHKRREAERTSVADKVENRLAAVIDQQSQEIGDLKRLRESEANDRRVQLASIEAKQAAEITDWKERLASSQVQRLAEIAQCEKRIEEMDRTHAARNAEYQHQANALNQKLTDFGDWLARCRAHIFARVAWRLHLLPQPPVSDASSELASQRRDSEG